MSDFVIEVENLSKCYHIYDKPRDRLLQMFQRGRRRLYREFWALADVSLSVRRGETVGIIGRNGSGKSTLLQLICGTLNPSSGSIQVNGRIAALLELGAGFNPEFTGRENVFLNGQILGLTKAEISSRLEEIISFADIGDHFDQPVKTYSSGMFVRLAFSVMAHSSPQVLVVDEALSVGDIRFQNKCLRKIEEMKRSGCTILFVSHSAQQVEALCERVVWLSDGRVKAIGCAKEIVRRYLNYMIHGINDESHGVVTSVSAPSVSAKPGVGWLDVSSSHSVEGGKKAKIVRLRVLAGEEILTVVQSEQRLLEIEAVVELQEVLAQPSFAVGVLNNLNEPVVHFNSQNTDNPLPAFEKVGGNLIIRARFSLPPLRPGEYLIAIGLDNGPIPHHEVVSHVYDAWQFSVRPVGGMMSQGGYVQVTDATLGVQVL